MDGIKRDRPEEESVPDASNYMESLGESVVLPLIQHFAHRGRHRVSQHQSCVFPGLTCAKPTTQTLKLIYQPPRAALLHLTAHTRLANCYHQTQNPTGSHSESQFQIFIACAGRRLLLDSVFTRSWMGRLFSGILLFGTSLMRDNRLGLLISLCVSSLTC